MTLVAAAPIATSRLGAQSVGDSTTASARVATVDARTLPAGTTVRIRGYWGECKSPRIVEGVLDVVAGDTVSLRIWPAFADRSAPPDEPFAIPLAAVKRVERAHSDTSTRPGRRPRVRWVKVPLPRDVRVATSCAPPEAALSWPDRGP
jgi:hypothetical protein